MTGRDSMANRLWALLAVVLLGTLVIASTQAPEFLPPPDRANAGLGPFEAPPLGTDLRGIPLVMYALQGAQVVTMPAVLAGVLVLLLSTVAGLSRCAGFSRLDTVIQSLSEVVGALPRLVVVLVVALAMPDDMRSLYPVAITWALLAAPGAMDEAAATAGRLGGDHFVEALRAHGFSAPRVYLYHIVWLNLRAVIVRQGAEVMMQVVFLEIALSYLAASQAEPSFTHADSTHSWATLLYQGYTYLVADTPMQHALILGLALIAAVAMSAQALRLAARGR